MGKEMGKKRGDGEGYEETYLGMGRVWRMGIWEGFADGKGDDGWGIGR